MKYPPRQQHRRHSHRIDRDEDPLRAAWGVQSQPIARGVAEDRPALPHVRTFRVTDPRGRTLSVLHVPEVDAEPSFTVRLLAALELLWPEHVKEPTTRRIDGKD